MSCIDHPPNDYSLTIHKSHVDLCERNTEAAILLAFLDDVDPGSDMEPTVEHTLPSLRAELNRLLTLSDIRRALFYLKRRGFIYLHTHPSDPARVKITIRVAQLEGALHDLHAEVPV